jgi:hypothetical protein
MRGRVRRRAYGPVDEEPTGPSLDEAPGCRARASRAIRNASAVDVPGRVSESTSASGAPTAATTRYQPSCDATRTITPRSSPVSRISPALLR